MAQILNLRTARKRALRKREEQAAEANRLVHGEPKQLKELNSAQVSKRNRDLDAHLIDRGKQK